MKRINIKYLEIKKRSKDVLKGLKKNQNKLLQDVGQECALIQAEDILNNNNKLRSKNKK